MTSTPKVDEEMYWSREIGSSPSATRWSLNAATPAKAWPTRVARKRPPNARLRPLRKRNRRLPFICPAPREPCSTRSRPGSGPGRSRRPRVRPSSRLHLALVRLLRALRPAGGRAHPPALRGAGHEERVVAQLDLRLLAPDLGRDDLAGAHRHVLQGVLAVRALVLD